MGEKKQTSAKAPKSKQSNATTTASVAAPAPARAPKPPKGPNANVLELVLHAVSLGATVRANLDGLSTAKVFEADAAQLEADAERLRGLENDWLAADAAATPGAVAKARTPLQESRNKLFGDIAAYVDDDEERSVAKELRDIGEVTSDADLESDVRRLIVLARRHADNLAGTELTPAIVDAAAANLKAFMRAREGAVASTGQTKAKLVAAANTAVEARNAAYWSLLKLDQLVCKRGRRRFHQDPATRTGFGAFSTAKRRGVKKAATTRRKKAKAKKDAVVTG